MRISTLRVAGIVPSTLTAAPSPRSRHAFDSGLLAANKQSALWLAELNAAIAELLKRLNDEKPLRRLGRTRLPNES
ncbi:MAG: hypothetical protein WB689_20715 [Xanthobacteraceae bacterium]